MIKKTTPFLFFFLFLFAAHYKVNAQANCQCWQTRDTSFHPVPFVWDSSSVDAPLPPDYRNDDGVTNPFVLPFKFCFWGQSIDTLYINNNGNISFGQPYSSYVPDGFPLNFYAMIAPFWGDVDTRNNTSSTPSGIVYYKMTPTYLIVQWDSVGYYDENTDKLNTFQLIISNGTDPIIPYGNNVEFCYKTMQWTTGDASGGTNGFGGSPATVGVNEGDGVNYLQFGLFDTAGTKYLGEYPPGPEYDGVGWLNNQTFVFNTCPNTISPIARGITPCDTLIICMGDTTDIDISFLSPKASDSSHANLKPPILSGISIKSNTPGNTDSIIIQAIGNAANYGFHTITVYGFDNEKPPDTTFVSFVLEVDSNATGTIVASKDTICLGDSVNLTGITNGKTYNWSTGQTTSSIEVKPAVTTTYTLQISKGVCNSTLSKQIVVLSSLAPTLSILKDSLCAGDSTTLTATGGGTYKWIPGGATTSTINVKPGSTTTYSVIVKSSCADDTLSKKLTILPYPVISVSRDTALCAGQSTKLTATGGGAYKWSNGATTSTINVTPGSTQTFSVSVSNGKCQKDTTVTVSINPPPPIDLTSSKTICQGSNVVLQDTAKGSVSYLWSNGATTSSITVTPGNTTTYTLVVNNGCLDSATTSVTVLIHTLTTCCDTTIISGDTVTINASGSASYAWAPNPSSLSCYTCPDPVASPTITTTYTVTAIDNNGCTDEKAITIVVECLDFTVPNVFTPNNDGINDDLVIKALNPSSYTINIYDRWGKEVYTSNDPTKYWNGDLINTQYLVPDGVYYYIIKATCGGNNYDKHGFVQVIGGK